MSEPDRFPSNNDQPRPSPGASELMPEVYDVVRHLAQAYLQRERPGHTLQPTALVHEAYLRLVKIDKMEFQDEAHFTRAAAGAIRRILVDHARARQSEKRGGDWQRVTISALESQQTPIDMLALNDALEQLAMLDRMAVRIVELRFFGGMTIEETAQTLGAGVTSIKDKWAFAKAWLQRELERSDG